METPQANTATVDQNSVVDGTPLKGEDKETDKIAHHHQTPLQDPLKRTAVKRSTPRTPSIIHIEPNTGAPIGREVNQNENSASSSFQPLMSRQGSSAVYSNRNGQVQIAMRPIAEMPQDERISSTGSSSPFTVHHQHDNMATGTAAKTKVNVPIGIEKTGRDILQRLNSGTEDIPGINSQDMTLKLSDVDISMDAEYGSGPEEESPTLNRKRLQCVQTNSAKRPKLSALFDRIKAITSRDSADGILSNAAVTGSSEEDFKEGKYHVINQPVYNPQNGETDATYLEVLGANDDAELDSTDEDLLKNMKLSLDDWIAKGETINKEHMHLVEETVVARMKFNKRLQLILDTLDEFALKLETSEKEIEKRAKALKEYCAKIVREI